MNSSHLIVEPIKAFNDNYIWAIRNNRDQSVIIVDPGDPTPVIQYLNDHKATIKAILITHHHNDHIGALPTLKTLGDYPIIGPVGESIELVSKPVSEGQSISFDEWGIEFTVLDIPGHTKGHIAFYSKPWLFCGDTLFAGGCGRLFEGTPAQMHQSLTKLSELDDDTLVFCAHEYTLSNLTFALEVEPHNQKLQQRLEEVKTLRNANRITLPSTIKEEKETNPFLRCHIPDIQEKIAENVHSTQLSVVEVFKAVRQWKDKY